MVLGLLAHSVAEVKGQEVQEVGNCTAGVVEV
jgi:hypothetical protein